MMDIGVAIKWMRHGEKVRRRGWNGKGMWLVLVRDVRFDHIDSKLPLSPSAFDEGEVRVTRINVEPWVGMKTADDKFIPWLASQSDLLADDWEVVNAD